MRASLPSLVLAFLAAVVLVAAAPPQPPAESMCNPGDSDGCLCIYIGCAAFGSVECASVEIPGREEALFCDRYPDQ